MLLKQCSDILAWYDKEKKRLTMKSLREFSSGREPKEWNFSLPDPAFLKPFYFSLSSDSLSCWARTQWMHFWNGFMPVSTARLACGIHSNVLGICFVVPQSLLIRNYIFKDIKEGREERIILEKKH